MTSCATDAPLTVKFALPKMAKDPDLPGMRCLNEREIHHRRSDKDPPPPPPLHAGPQRSHRAGRCQAGTSYVYVSACVRNGLCVLTCAHRKRGDLCRGYKQIEAGSKTGGQAESDKGRDKQTELHMNICCARIAGHYASLRDM